MGNKLDTGDAFPALTLNMLDGSQTRLPDEPAGNYQIVLFYRGFF